MGPWQFVFLAALLLIVGCGGKEQENSQGQPIKLQYLTWGADPDEIEICQTLIREFESEHPGVIVEHITVPGASYYAKLLTMIASTTPPDVVYMQPSNFPEFAARGGMLSLDPFVSNDPSIQLSDFYPQMLDAYRWEGKLYGLPCDSGAIVLFYNKDLFDAQNLPYPDSTWDHEKLLQVSEQLTHRDENGKVTQYGYMPFSWECNLWQFGGKILSEDGQKCLLNEPPAVEAFQFLFDLREKYQVSPSYDIEMNYGGTLGAGGEELFKAQKLAMVEYGRWVMIHFQRLKDLNWDVAVLPKGKRQRASLVIGLGWCIPEQSRHPKEAYEFVKFMSSPRALRVTASLGLLVPARRSVAEAPDFLSLDPNHNLRAFSDSMEFGRMHPTTPQVMRILEVVREKQELIYLHQRTVEEACNEMANEIDAFIKAGK